MNPRAILSPVSSRQALALAACDFRGGRRAAERGRDQRRDESRSGSIRHRACDRHCRSHERRPILLRRLQLRWHVGEVRTRR